MHKSIHSFRFKLSNLRASNHLSMVPVVGLGHLFTLPVVKMAHFIVLLKRNYG